LLRELAERERSLLETKVYGAKGLVEEKHRQLAEAGVYAEYGDIHRAYVSLVDHTPSGVEALKRALFLGWYAVCEPACFTGIWNLDTSAEAAVFVHLSQRVREGLCDPDLTGMLGWYYHVAGYYFDSHLDVDVVSLVRSFSVLEAASSARGAFEGRGQMGTYWTSLAGGRGRRTRG
jgi:hypothetical protein